MNSASSHPFSGRSLVLARTASGGVAIAGASVLIGWLFEIPRLQSLFLPGPSLKTNAAVALICGGLANLLLISTAPRTRWRVAVGVLAGIPALLGALTLSQHLIGWNLGIDQFLASEPVGAFATTSPNRMGPPASVANLLLGIAILFGLRSSAKHDARSTRLAAMTCVLALLPLLGYAYGFSELYAIAQYTGISLVNATALFVLGVAVQAGRPKHGLAAFLCRGDEVGVFARRMLPAALLLPFCVGLLLTRLRGADVIDTAFALSTMALVLIVAFALLIWSTGAELARQLHARDLAQRALSEREQALREADQRKTEFLALLSHELRNPLAPIRFAVHLLDGPPETAARARRTIERQVQHIAKLIDDLLDLTRISRNRLQLHTRPVAIAELMQEAVDSVGHEIARAGQEVEIMLPHPAAWVVADPDRVVQILVNLLTNAMHYGAPGQTIQVGAVVEDAEVMLFVRDQGQGIDPTNLERVFEQFVQIGKSHHGGLGIGLALVKALAELHGGRVQARSEGLGRGAEFRVHLPRTTAPVPKEAPVHPAERPCRILVVDDNRDAADMLGNVLSVKGHHVAVAYSGEDALRQAGLFKPQVGLLDIGMAGMDGYELATRLRNDSNPPELFLIAITGWGQEDDRRRALSAGFDAHLTKPADPEVLAALLASRFPLAEAQN